MANLILDIPTESSLANKECIKDLVALLKRKYIQSLAFACYIVRPENKEKFLNDLSLAETIFIQYLHGLFNEDGALCAMVSEFIQSNSNFYKSLMIHTPEFEFWARQNFKLQTFKVKAALVYSNKIRNSGLFITPKSIYRIFRGYVCVLYLRPAVRDMLVDAKKSTQEETNIQCETELDLDNDSIPITTAEWLEKSNKKKSTSQKIHFVKKESYFDITKIDNCEHWRVLEEKYREVLQAKVLEGLKFICASSIYGKQFTLNNIESDPIKRMYVLWLYGILHRDHTLSSLTCNWLAFAVAKDSTILSEKFCNWLETTFIFPKKRLLAGARFLRRLKLSDLFFIPPRLEEIFVLLPIPHTKPFIEVNLKDIVEGNVKRPKRKKKKVDTDQTTLDVEKTSSEIGETISPQYVSEEISQGQVLFDSSETQKYDDEMWVDPTVFWPHCQSLQPPMPPVPNVSSIVNVSQPPLVNVSLPQQPQLDYYQLDGSNIGYTNHESVYHLPETIGFNCSENTTQSVIPSNPYARSVLPSNPYPIDVNECGSSNSQALVKQSIPPTAGGFVEEAETRGSPVTLSTALPFQQRPEADSRSPIVPQPPSPPIITRAESSKTLTSSKTNEGGIKDNSVDSILCWLEEKDRVIKEALVKACETGRSEDVKRLASASGPELVRKASDVGTGESLLHIAAREDHESIVEYLAGVCDLDGRDLLGQTPLHTAVLHGRVTVVEILLESGADPALKDKEGKTPHDIAVSLGKKRLAEKITKLSK